jgi:hypothetical protein
MVPPLRDLQIPDVQEQITFQNSSLSLSLSPVPPILEHSACVKRFVSLQFFNPKTVGRTPWTGDQPIARLRYLHRTTQTE